jgi:hypothetical protein
MIRMKHLAYRHTVVIPLVETMFKAIRRMLPGPLQFPNAAAGPVPVWRYIAAGIGILIALAVQAALLLLVAELVEVAHGVMELYLDLAQQQLDLTSLYVAATSPE